MSAPTTETTKAPSPKGPNDSIKITTLSPALRIGLIVGAAIAAGLILTLVGALSIITLLILGAVLYIIAVYVVSRRVEGKRHATDRAVTGVVTTFFLLALLPLLSLVYTVLSMGISRMDAQFFTYSMSRVSPDEGGIYHAIMGTLIITAITAVISIPVGIFAAIYLVEYGKRNRLSRALTFFVDVMTGIPSIVAGLFAVALFTLIWGPGARAGIIGATALCVLMIPVVVRSTEEMLRLVPNDLREASYALGVPKWLTIVKVVIPTSIAGIATGVTLAIARVIGETAPLLVTVGITTAVNLNPTDGRMATLPVFVYNSYAYPQMPREAFTDLAWAAALTLILIVMALNLIARMISKFFAPKTGR